MMIGNTVWRRLGISITDPCCARCGYNVKGLPSFTCPECGTDLRETGIHTPGHYLPDVRRFLSLTWQWARLFLQALFIALRAGFAAGFKAFRVVWRGGMQHHPGSVRFKIDFPGRE
jgi:hypothetical protein